MTQLFDAGPRMDAATVGALRGRLDAATAEGAGDLVLDLSAVEFLDVIGVGMLLGVQRRCALAGRRLVLRNAAPRLSKLLVATRLDRVLTLER
jgi:anti-anti-sigma factor